MFSRRVVLFYIILNHVAVNNVNAFFLHEIFVIMHLEEFYEKVLKFGNWESNSQSSTINNKFITKYITVFTTSYHHDEY